MAILGGLAKHRRPLTSFTSSQEIEKGWSYDPREFPILGESLLAVQAGLSQHETALGGQVSLQTLPGRGEADRGLPGVFLQWKQPLLPPYGRGEKGRDMRAPP